MPDPLIQLRDIRRTFHVGEMDVPVLKGVTLDIARGDLVALTGASGSGKTTLMNILGCLDRPTSGEYVLDGQEVSRLSSDQRAMIRNKKIGFVFQSFNLLTRTSALDQVIMPLAYTPAQLSGGQQQRIAIARALINHPPVLFADEPTGNLDSKTTMEILQMFQELNRTDGITIVIVTHDPNVAAHCRRNIRMRDGVLESDTVGEARTAAQAAGVPA